MIRWIFLCCALVAFGSFSFAVQCGTTTTVVPGTGSASPVTLPGCAGISISYEGIGVSGSGATGCPEWTEYIPAHGEPVAGGPEEMEAYIAGQLDITKQEWKCVACGFLWLSKCCRRNGAATVVNTVDDWRTRPCAPRVRPNPDNVDG